jgi:hypothetical protein
MDLRFGVGAIAFPHFELATLGRQVMGVTKRHVGECKPSLGAVDIRLSWREGNGTEPSVKNFGCLVPIFLTPIFATAAGQNSTAS